MIFFKYFIRYIFSSKKRQGLLLIAIVGLLLSSFSLMMIQGIMGGLQSGLLERSKKALGHGVIRYSDMNIKQDINALDAANVIYSKEYEVELLLVNKKRVTPSIVHGVDYNGFIPDFLKSKDKEGIILGSDLSSGLSAYFGSKIKLISPAHSDYIFGDVPRQITTSLSDFFMSELYEIDSVHSWIDIKKVQNLIRSRSINTLRFFDKKNFEIAKSLVKFGTVISWERKNKNLVYALNLETNVMRFLFISMSILIALCITSGFMIFYSYLKRDLISFWILGLSKNKIMKLTLVSTQMIGLLTTFTGVLLGLLCLLILKNNEISLMPEFFVERKIPVLIDFGHIAISFLIPYAISTIFSYLSFRFFKNENSNFVSVVRKIG